jgi:hypothetical protein
MKRYIKSSVVCLSDLTDGLVRKRSVDIEFPNGKLQSVIRYENPTTNESFAVVSTGAGNFAFAKIIPVSKKQYQVVDIIQDNIL